MAITKVQQYQISGSLSYNDTMSAGSSLQGKTSLTDDLNALRSQIKRIVGKDNWYSDIDGSQDLADIRAAVHMTGTAADFQGKVDITGVATLDSDLYVAGAAGISGSLTVAQAATMSNGLTVNGAAADFNAGVTANSIKIDGDTAQRLYIVDSDGSLKDESKLTFDGSKLAVQGAADIQGVADADALFVSGETGLSGSLTVAGVASFAAITGSAGLKIAGDADFNGGVAANKISIDGDVAQRLYIVDSDGSIKDESKLTFNGSKLAITGDVSATIADFASMYASSAVGISGSLTVAQAATMNNGMTVNTAVADFNAGITANEIKIDSDVAGRLYIVGASGELADESSLTWGSSKLTVAGALDAQGVVDADALYVSGPVGLSGSVTMAGGLTVNTAAADFNAGITANEIKIDGDTATRLYIVDSDGSMKDESKLTFDGSELKVTGAAWITGNAKVDGDLYVKGAMTYIETTNMKVKDAFVYLATGSAGSEDSGIVLSKGAGNNHDLVIGQDGGAGEVIFAKVSHNASADSPADLNGAALVAAWMNEVKLGGSEGSLVGSVRLNGSDLEMKAETGAALKLIAFGDETFSLAADGEQATFDANFTATTIIGAINELYTSVTATDNLKGTFTKANVNASRELSFATLGSLTTPDHKNVDVFLNGVLLAPGYDLESSVGSTKVTLKTDLYNSLSNDDVFTVVLRAV